MITVNNLSFNFGGQLLFKNVDLKFTKGNCYGVIGANGAGKTTFFKLICGELEPTTGNGGASPRVMRMSVLRQDHFAFDAYTVLDTVIMGNQTPVRYHEGKRRSSTPKRTFSDEDGIRAAELEGDFAELGRLGSGEPTSPA